MKNKFRSYGFWTALAAAVVVLINALGSVFGFSVNDEIVTNVIMAVAGLLVVLGVVSMPSDKDKPENDNSQDLTEDEEDKTPNEKEDNS